MTDKDWCSQHGISTTSLYRHIRKLRMADHPVPGHDAAPLSNHERHEVVSLSIMDTAGETGCQTVRTASLPLHQGSPGGIHITIGSFHVDIGENASASALQETLRILQEIC